MIQEKRSMKPAMSKKSIMDTKDIIIPPWIKKSMAIIKNKKQKIKNQ